MDIQCRPRCLAYKVRGVVDDASKCIMKLHKFMIRLCREELAGGGRPGCSWGDTILYL
jgi:hypothetical protein